MRIVAHIDMDAFYAAEEERHYPELRGGPVVVGADPKAGKGRGVVTAANYTARKYGIRSALPISRAWRLADVARKRGEPEAVFVLGDRSLYREVSDRIMAIIPRGADAFEEASIDEAYVDLSSLGDMEGAVGHVRGLKAEILAQEGLTCSAGIGPNKLVAKIASDFRKPDGLTVVRPEEVETFLDRLRIRVIPGIEPKTEAFLHGKGVKAVAELRRVERAQLTAWFGKWGLDLGEKARGISDDAVSNDWERTDTCGVREERCSMPRYEFLCETCQKPFELIMAIAEREKTKPTCPKCKGTKVVPQFSGFMAQTAKKT